MDQNFEKISMTARLTATMRQYSDIPFAKDVATHIRANETLETLLHEQQMRLEDILWYAPLLEVRYKSIVRAIEKSGIKQVLELASGLSLRGLAMTQDPDMVYVETDLETITQEKRALVSELQQKYDLPIYGNHYLSSANALNGDQLWSAVQPFSRSQPIAIVAEGLLQYLSMNELETVARNVCDLLREFSGIWITTDFTIKQDVRHTSEQQQRFRRAISGATGRVLYENAFESEEQLQSFFKNLGLCSRTLSQVEEVPHLVSVGALNESAQQAWHHTAPKLKIWVLKY